MFERFTGPARETVLLAQDEARTLHHNHIGTEHLLLGVLRQGTGVGARVLGRLGVDLEGARADVVHLIGEGPEGVLEPNDAEALRAIGIDVDEVRRRVEETFGPGALERTARARRRRWGRGRCESTPGHIPFTPRSKKVLELALRQARRLGHAYIGTEHILLGLVVEDTGIAARALRERGASAHRVEQAVMEALSHGEGRQGRSA